MPDPCEHDFLSQQGLHKCNQVKMRLYCVKVDPNLMTGVLIKGKFGHKRRRHFKEDHVMTETEIGVMCTQAKGW